MRDRPNPWHSVLSIETRKSCAVASSLLPTSIGRWTWLVVLSSSLSLSLSLTLCCGSNCCCYDLWHIISTWYDNQDLPSFIYLFLQTTFKPIIITVVVVIVSVIHWLIICLDNNFIICPPHILSTHLDKFCRSTKTSAAFHTTRHRMWEHC